MKSQILAAIGEPALQPALSLNAALAANDRLKYAFSLLQMAMDYAEHPEQQAVTLQHERMACGIDNPDLDTAISAARMSGNMCHMPGARQLMTRIADDMRMMAAPVLALPSNDMAKRFDRLLGALPAAADDLLDPKTISAMMQAGHDGPDSLHRLVMDLHKKLNAMLADIATENLAGAAVYNLGKPDRPLVTAFMAGLNRTARLKFNHPGLATTATRAGGKLIIQNDIGTTDAHVIVIHVQDFTVSVTYTDVHEERLTFFQEMLKPQALVWEGSRGAQLAAGAAFTMATGRLEAKTSEACCACLEFLGARLVFLIDWNRARKQLRNFLRAPDRLALLHWAAAAEIGHRGFLELGGAHLVNHAIEATAGSSMHFGDRLCEVLGDKESQDFLRAAFRFATEGLLAGQSQALIRDRVRTALGSHFSNEGQQLLRLAEDHAGLIFELGCAVRDGLQPESGDAGKRAKRARRFEHDADHLVMETREAVRRRPEFAVFLGLMEAADEAADAFEEAAFLLELDTPHGKPLADLQSLGDLLAAATQEWVKALGHARQIGGAANTADAEDFLTAIDRVATIEHLADDAERKVAATAFRYADDFRQLHLYSAVGGKLEAAADALKHASLILRDYVLESVIDG
jgi:uncharacterized protein Yka (UPF0111/DUF47 family)